MRCGQVREKLDLFVAGELARSVHAAIEAHVEQCSDCRQALRKLRQLQASLAACDVPPVPEGFATRVVGKAKERMATATGSGYRRRVSWATAGKYVGFSVRTATALAAGLALGAYMGQATWLRSAAAIRGTDPRPESGFQQFVEPGGPSLAQAYLGLIVDLDS